jgi:hypothetical protein
MAVFIGIADSADKGAWSKLDAAVRAEIQARGMAAWGDWMAKNSGNIVDAGAPLGKTKRASSDGLSDTSNTLTAYIIVEADFHQDAIQMFDQHPHFSIFPGDSIEVMEILPMPGME